MSFLVKPQLKYLYSGRNNTVFFLLCPKNKEVDMIFFVFGAIALQGSIQQFEVKCDATVP